MSSFERFDGLTRQEFASSCNIEPLLNDRFFADSEYVVAWYGEIIKENLSFFVKVYFVNRTSEFYIPVKIPFQLIPQMPIGSIWKAGRSISKFVGGSLSLVTLRDTFCKGSALTNITYLKPEEASKDPGRVEAKAARVLYDLLNDRYRIDKRHGFSDENTIITVPVNTDQGEKTLLIHPLMFMNAHYSVPNEVSFQIISLQWKDIFEKWHLDYKNPQNEKAVLLPNNLTVGDAVFLSHIKHHAASQKRVHKLNSSIESNFRNTKRTAQDENTNKTNTTAYSYLEVAPYHEQPINLSCNYIEIDDKTLLCTQITGMSQPQGETVYYDINRKERVTGEGGDVISGRFKPVVLDITNGEMLITEERANNRSGAMLSMCMETIGDLRKVVRNENISLDKVLARKVIVVPEPTPEAFSGSMRIGSGGNVGIIKTTLENRVQCEPDEYGARGLDTQYQKLLKHAQYVKNNAKGLKLGEVIIDCRTPKGDLVGETVEPHLTDGKWFPKTIFVLRIKIGGELYYFLDCEAIGNQSSSGLAVQVFDEDRFLSKAWSPECTLVNLIKGLKSNQGRLSDINYAAYRKGGQKTNVACVARYKHASQEVSNWVTIGVGKF